MRRVSSTFLVLTVGMLSLNLAIVAASTPVFRVMDLELQGTSAHGSVNNEGQVATSIQNGDHRQPGVVWNGGQWTYLAEAVAHAIGLNYQGQLVGSFAQPEFPVGELPPSLSAQGNPIVIENQQAGTDQWQLDLRSNDVDGQIKGYASATSINKGEHITFYVSVNPAQTYTIDVYRIGWYQGLGGVSCST